MSKQSKAKEKQGYRRDCPCCANCSFFLVETEEKKSNWSSVTFMQEKNLRCGIGEFKVMKRSWCEEHEFRTNPIE